MLKFDYLDVIEYSDSKFARNLNFRKSTFGCLFLLVGGAISRKSTKQSIIATSTMEAKFVTCFEIIVHELWLQNFILRLR